MNSQHIEAERAIVSTILDDTYGILTTVASAKHVLFTANELHVRNRIIDPSRPLASYVKVGKTEFLCDACYTTRHLKWSLEYVATCVWEGEKPSDMKILSRSLPINEVKINLPTNVQMVGQVMRLAPPKYALVCTPIYNFVVPVVVCLDKLYSFTFEKLDGSEYIQDHLQVGIQDHLQVGDIVYFQVERKHTGRRACKTHYVAQFAWKSPVHTSIFCCESSSGVDAAIHSGTERAITSKGSEPKLHCASPQTRDLFAAFQEDYIAYQKRGNLTLRTPMSNSAVSMYKLVQPTGKLKNVGLVVLYDVNAEEPLTLHFSYELFKSLHELTFNAVFDGYVVIDYKQPQSSCQSSKTSARRKHSSVDEYAKAGITILRNSDTCTKAPSPAPQSSNTYLKSAILQVQLKVPAVQVLLAHNAIPKIPSMTEPGMSVEIMGAELRKNVPSNILTRSRQERIKIPVVLRDLPTQDMRIPGGELYVNHRVKLSCLQAASCTEEIGKFTSVRGTFQRSFNKRKQKCSKHITRSVLQVPIFRPTSQPATSWTLVYGSMEIEGRCLMYIPSTVLTSTPEREESLPACTEVSADPQTSEEKVSFHRDGTKPHDHSKLLSHKTDDTVNVKQFSNYEATKVSLETCASPKYAGRPLTMSARDQKNMDQTGIEDELFHTYAEYLLTQHFQHSNFPIELLAVRRHVFDCTCSDCVFENSFMRNRISKDLPVGELTVPAYKTAETCNTSGSRSVGNVKSSKDVAKDKGKIKSTELLSGAGPVKNPVPAKKAKQINNPKETTATKMNVQVKLGPLPDYAENVSGIVEAMWSDNAAIVTARIHKHKVRALIYNKSLFVNGKQCSPPNMLRRYLTEGIQICANLTKLRYHPSGATYVATCAWKGKKPKNIIPHDSVTCSEKPEECYVVCLKPNDDARGVQNIGSAPVDKGVPKKLKNGDKSQSTSNHGKEQKSHKGLKSLLDKTFLGIVQSFEPSEGFGVVAFKLENDEVRAIFFRESISVNGASVTDLQIEKEITTGRSVVVSNICPYYGENLQYAANIETEQLPNETTNERLPSYSAVATDKMHDQKQEEVENNVQTLELPAVATDKMHDQKQEEVENNVETLELPAVATDKMHDQKQEAVENNVPTLELPAVATDKMHDQKQEEVENNVETLELPAVATDKMHDQKQEEVENNVQTLELPAVATDKMQDQKQEEVENNVQTLELPAVATDKMQDQKQEEVENNVQTLELPAVATDKMQDQKQGEVENNVQTLELPAVATDKMHDQKQEEVENNVQTLELPAVATDKMHDQKHEEVENNVQTLELPAVATDKMHDQKQEEVENNVQTLELPAVATDKMHDQKQEEVENNVQTLELPAVATDKMQDQKQGEVENNVQTLELPAVATDKMHDQNKSDLKDVSEVHNTDREVECQDEEGTACAPDDRAVGSVLKSSEQPLAFVKELKRQLGTVKSYKSSTRGILECSIGGINMEIIFPKRVVKSSKASGMAALKECLPIGTEVYFDAQMVGAESLLGCTDIVVTSVYITKSLRKQSISRTGRPLEVQFKFPDTREGLVKYRTYVGTVSHIEPPSAFVVTVMENAKAHHVFVLGRFFAPAEYGKELPKKHPVSPYIEEGDEVFIIANKRKEENKNYRYEWFAVKAWTEAGDDRLLEDHTVQTEPVLTADTGFLEEVIMEGVILSIYPEWASVKSNDFEADVTVFRNNAFLYGVPLTALDLREVFRSGEKLNFTLAEETTQSNGPDKASRAWLGSCDMSSIAQRSLSVFNYCKTRGIDKAVLLALTNELGKQRKELESRGVIHAQSITDDSDEENFELKSPAEHEMTSGTAKLTSEPDCRVTELCDKSIQFESDDVYFSDSDFENDVYKSDDDDCLKEVPVKASNLPRKEELAEPSGKNTSFVKDLLGGESVNCDVPGREPPSKSPEETGACAEPELDMSQGASEACAVQQLVLHPDMRRKLQLSLRETLEKHNVQSDLLSLVTSKAMVVLEEEAADLFVTELLERTLQKVAGMMCETSVSADVEVSSALVPGEDAPLKQLFQSTGKLSQEWREVVLQSEEQETRFVDESVQTTSTGAVLYLKVLSNC